LPFGTSMAVSRRLGVLVVALAGLAICGCTLLKPIGDVFGFWQGLLRVVGSFGDCPRCLAVCPVGNDYHAHLADTQKAIPEKTPEKVALGKSYRDNRAQGADIAGLNDWNRRWVGPEGYKGMVARQLQEFKKTQQQRTEEALVAADERGRT